MAVTIKPVYINEFLQKIVSFYPKELEIEFKVSKFNTVFLDIPYGLGYESYVKNELYFRVYQKPFNAYAYLDRDSNHPFGVFKGIVKTECHRYKYLSCNKEEYDHICKLFKVRLRRCGYRESFINKHVIAYEQDTITQKKVQNNNIRCKINFNKSHNVTKIYKNILNTDHKYNNAIRTCYVTGKKLKTMLLTKKKLHCKLQDFMMQMSSS